jgi:hypothetical protein
LLELHAAGKLPREVQVFLNDGELEYSHARVLNLEDPDVLLKVARRAVADDGRSTSWRSSCCSIRACSGRGRKRRRAVEAVRAGRSECGAAQRDLERILAVKVRIRDHKGKERSRWSMRPSKTLIECSDVEGEELVVVAGR